MASVVLLPSGRFRGFARVREMREAQVFDKRADAETWSDKTEQRMRAGKWVKTPAQAQQVRGLTVEEAFERYRESEEWLRKALNTRKSEAGKQKAVIKLLGARELRSLTKDDVTSYLAKRRKEQPVRAVDKEQKLSNHQLRLELAAMSSLCNYAVEQEWIEANVTRDVKRPKGDRRKLRLTDEQVGAIMSHDAILKDDKAYVFFRILLSSVCRPGELSSARKEWLRSDPPQIQLPRTKNEDERNIILPVHLFELIDEMVEAADPSCPYLFGTPKLSRTKPGWSPYNYATVWKKVAKDLNLKGTGIVPYLARHEGISRLFERTALSDGQIGGLTGHRSAQALWHYKHLRNEHQRPIINALDQMYSDAMDRGISQLHPSQSLGPGEMLTPKPDRKRRRNADMSLYVQPGTDLNLLGNGDVTDEA